VEWQSTFRPGFMFPSVGRKFQNPNETLHHAFSTPMAAPAADQPTAPSWRLLHPSPNVQVPYPPAHTFDTTSTDHL
jgi:hypothetical protein